MDRAGRTEPYTEIGIKRMKCVRCGKPASQQWAACADGGLWRPICLSCDVILNRLVLQFMLDPDTDEKIKTYSREMQG
jgi:hypothetical protein